MLSLFDETKGQLSQSFSLVRKTHKILNKKLQQSVWWVCWHDTSTGSPLRTSKSLPEKVMFCSFLRERSKAPGGKGGGKGLGHLGGGSTGTARKGRQVLQEAQKRWFSATAQVGEERRLDLGRCQKPYMLRNKRHYLRGSIKPWVGVGLEAREWCNWMHI